MKLAKTIVLCLFVVHTAYSQVGEVRDRAENYESGNSEVSTTGSSSFDNGSSDLMAISWDLIQLPFYGIYLAQSDQLAKAKTQSWRINGEARLKLGFGPQNNVVLLDPMGRINWGIFSSQIRMNRIFDNSGIFSTLDWQVIQVNFMNNEFVRFTSGVGASWELETDQSHFEWTAELWLPLGQQKLMPGVIYRQSADGYPRQEVAVDLHYKLTSKSAFHPTLGLGYTYQDLYDISFHYVTAHVGVLID